MTVQVHENKGPVPLIRVLYTNTSRSVEFHSSWDSTLQAVWDEAYIKLGEQRKAKDELSCEKEGTSLMSYLSLTLAELRDKHICPDRHFQISGDSGGATRG